MQLGQSVVWASKISSSSICVRIDSDLNDLKPVEEIFLVEWILWEHLVSLPKAATSFSENETSPNFRISLPISRTPQSMFFTSFIIQHSWRLFSIHSPDLIGSPNSSWLFWYYSQLVPCLLHNTLEAGVLNGVPFSSPFQNILELYKCCQSVIWLSSPKQKQTNIFFSLVSQAMLSDRGISKEIHKWSWSIQGH